MSAAPGTPRFTAAQRSAVERRDSDLCVVAGAGSGKTSVLTERFVSLVLGSDPSPAADGDDGVHGERLRAVDRILTLTFTEKAATEMRERVARRFAEEGARRAAAGPAAAAAGVARRFQELRRSVESAWIGTFHGFCARLLKENAVEAGVDPSFAVLAEGDAALLLEEAIGGALEELLEGDGDPAALDGLALLAEPELEERLPWLLERCRVPGRPPSEALHEARRRPPAGDLVRDLEAALDALRGARGTFKGAGVLKAEAALLAGAGLRHVNRSDIDALEAAASAVRGAFTLQCGEPAKTFLREVRDACDGLLALATTHRGAAAADSLALLLDAVDRRCRALRAREGRLDFADLEERALALLEGDVAVREEMLERFDRILVDEYQDTSPVQARLLALLRGEGDPAGAIGDEPGPAAAGAANRDRHFVVGDPKQAVYGFRGASVKGFLDERARVGTAGTIVLADNFRSRPEILHFSNAVLAPAFLAGGAAQVPYEPLVPGLPHGGRAIPSVELRIVVPSHEDDTTADLRPREAALLAERLQALVEGREILLTRKDAEGIPDDRPLRWGDAAVLLRAMSDLKVYERALAARDIPFQVLKGRGFYEAREVVDLANLLEALDNPRRDLALAAALRSPFAGLDDDTLLALCTERDRRGGGAALSELLTDPFVPPGAGRGQGERIRAFAAVWRSLLAERRRGRLHSLVERALSDTGYEEAMLLRPGGRQGAANLRKVRGRARAFEADGLGGLPEFVRALRRLRLREERETEAPVAAEDAVSILTVHQAKGLEWPLVCIPDLGRRPPAVSGSVLVRAGRAAVKVRTEAGSIGTPLHEELKAEETAAQEAESVRLLHVALTRAREYLLLSGCTRDLPAEAGRPPAVETKSWLGILRPAFEGVTWPAPNEERILECGGAATGDDEGALLPTVEVRVALCAPKGVAGPSRREPLSVLHRKRLLAGRGPGKRSRLLTRADRAAVLAEVNDVTALERSRESARRERGADPVPYLLTVSALLDREDDGALYRRRHLLGVADRRPAALPGPDDVHVLGEANLGGEGPRRASRSGDDDEVPATEAKPRGGAGGADGSLRDGVPRWVEGVAVHAALGLMSFAQLQDDAAVAAFARERMVEELQRTPPHASVERIVGWVRRFRASTLGARLFAMAEREPGRVLREVPFLFKATLGGGPGQGAVGSLAKTSERRSAKTTARGERVILRGQIDLLFRDDDGVWVVADYKASPLPSRAAARRRYERQVRLYAEALADVPDLGPARAMLIPLEGEPVEVELSA